MPKALQMAPSGYFIMSRSCFGTISETDEEPHVMLTRLREMNPGCKVTLMSARADESIDTHTAERQKEGTRLLRNSHPAEATNVYEPLPDALAFDIAAAALGFRDG